MYNELMSTESITTFVGLVAGTSLIVQFTKTIVKKQFGDVFVRLYTFIIALVLIMIFGGNGSGIRALVLKIVNAIVVSMSAMGGYEVMSDPMARKVRRKY